MEVTQQMKTEEVAGDVVHQFSGEDDLEKEEASLKRRITTAATRTINAGSTLTTLFFNEATRTSSGPGHISEELRTSNKPANDQETTGDREKKQGNGIQNTGKVEAGTEINRSQSKVKGANLAAGAKLKGVVDIQQTSIATATTHQVEEESSDAEEVVELEFHAAVQKIHTHDGYTMHCPNCRGRITKVVLRRKIPKPTVPADIPGSSCQEILGCASCLSFFVSCGNKLKLLNPLRLFGAGGDDGDAHDQPIPEEPTPEVVKPPPPGQENEQGGNDVRILVHEAPRLPPIATESGNFRSLEIVKSIVYGGLMESIVSLSIVSSAAASGATTLNILVLALANLVGGLVILAHNLKDLRYGDSVQTRTNEEKYEEELGRKDQFPLHATVAVLSYIIFGLVAPVTYGFTFRKSNDRDFKMLAAAFASLVCVFILGIAKAYTRRQHRFLAYFKTVSYYLTCAVMVSGIAFAVGELAKKLVETYGLFACSSSARQEPVDSFQPITWASY